MDKNTMQKTQENKENRQFKQREDSFFTPAEKEKSSIKTKMSNYLLLIAEHHCTKCILLSIFNYNSYNSITRYIFASLFCNMDRFYLCNLLEIININFILMGVWFARIIRESIIFQYAHDFLCEKAFKLIIVNMPWFEAFWMRTLIELAHKEDSFFIVSNDDWVLNGYLSPRTFFWKIF